jgi:Ca-activated chloride channel family protein
VGLLFGDAGVLIPSSVKEEPDPAILSLDEMRVTIDIDNQHASVSVLQIFASHWGTILEGKYLFALPPTALISDFAVWDDLVRIPGVILEKRRAEEIYDELTQQRIDPGLLKQEGDGAEGARPGVFSVKVAPIPAWGNKRLELSYTQTIPVEGLRSYFSFPLKPNLYGRQQVGHLIIDLTVRSDVNLRDFRLVSASYPLQIVEKAAQTVKGFFEGYHVELTEDFSVEYALDAPRSQLSFLAFRSRGDKLTEKGKPVTAFDQPAQAQKPEAGYFFVSALLNEAHLTAKSAADSPKNAPPKSVVLLLDTSLSMKWDKLKRAYDAVEYFLRGLSPQDDFNLILFNSEVSVFKPSTVAVSAGSVTQGLDFIKKSYMQGGTDLQAGLKAALDAAASARSQERYLVVVTDGNPTLGAVNSKKIMAWYHAQNRGHGIPVRTYVFGIGNDVNQVLLRELTVENNGHFAWVRETEEIEFALRAFFDKIGKRPIDALTLRTSAPDNVFQVYPSDEARAFDGSQPFWVGRYRNPATNISMTVSGNNLGRPVALNKTVSFPAEATTHTFVPRTWAKARVDALLRKIELEGEDQATIDEIIRLSKKYKFVTPYTAFLAAPRSLLRPRVIKPGDPVLRVRTDPSIVSVIAIFPFGLTKRLTYLASEDVWQTRFLAPVDMSDGTYRCRLLLRDKHGNSYEEEKSFVIDSKPPQLKLVSTEKKVRKGRLWKIQVSADSDTRQITGLLPNLPPVRIAWNAKEKLCTGSLLIPADLPTGAYPLKLVAEDFAHNTTTIETTIEIVN